jgi:hypothetical protein
MLIPSYFANIVFSARLLEFVVLINFFNEIIERGASANAIGEFRGRSYDTSLGWIFEASSKDLGLKMSKVNGGAYFAPESCSTVIHPSDASSIQSAESWQTEGPWFHRRRELICQELHENDVWRSVASAQRSLVEMQR